MLYGKSGFGGWVTVFLCWSCTVHAHLRSSPPQVKPVTKNKTSKVKSRYLTTTHTPAHTLRHTHQYSWRSGREQYWFQKVWGTWPVLWDCSEDAVVRCWGGCGGTPQNTRRNGRPSHAWAPLGLVAFLCWVRSLNSWHLITGETCTLRNTAHWETKGSDSWDWPVDLWGGQSPAWCLWKLREVSTRSKGDSPRQKARNPLRSRSTASRSVIKQPFPSSTFCKSSECTADCRQSWTWRSNAEHAWT